MVNTALVNICSHSHGYIQFIYVLHSIIIFIIKLFNSNIADNLIIYLNICLFNKMQTRLECYQIVISWFLLDNYFLMLLEIIEENGKTRRCEVY